MRLLLLAALISALSPLAAQDQVTIGKNWKNGQTLIAGADSTFTFDVRYQLASRSRAELWAFAETGAGESLSWPAAMCAAVERSDSPVLRTCEFTGRIPAAQSLVLRFALLADGARIASSDPVAYTVVRATAALALQFPGLLIERKQAADYPEPLKGVVTYTAPVAPEQVFLQVQSRLATGGFGSSAYTIRSAAQPADASGTVEVAFPPDFAAEGSAMRFRAAATLPGSSEWIVSDWVEKPVFGIRIDPRPAVVPADAPIRLTVAVDYPAIDSPRQWFCAFRSVAAGVASTRIVPPRSQDPARPGTTSAEIGCDLDASSRLDSLSLTVLNAPLGFDPSACDAAFRCPGVAAGTADLQLSKEFNLDSARTGAVSGAGATLSGVTGGASSTTTVTSAPPGPAPPDQPYLLTINRKWDFSPAVPESSGLQADLTLAYSPSDLPDDPAFDENKLVVVSYDPATGAPRSWPASLDKANRQVTARVSGIASRYTLGVFGPFQRKFWNFAAIPAGAGLATALTFVNAGAAPANLAIRGYAPGPSDPLSIALPAGRQWTGLAADIAREAGSRVSWIQAAADQPYSLPLAWVAAARGAAVLPPAVSPSAQLLPEIEWKNGWKAAIQIANTSPFPASATIDLYDSEGTLSGSAALNLSAKGAVALDPAALFAKDPPEAFSGYAIVRGSQALAAARTVASSVLLSILPGRALPAAGPSARFYAPHVSPAGTRARLTLVNTGTDPARITARLAREDGAAAPVVLTLPAGRQAQSTVASLFGLPDADPLAAALVLESDSAAVAATLTYLDAAGGFGTRASLPLESRPARSAVLPQIVNAAGYSTWIAIQNASATGATAQVQAIAADGTRLGTATLRLPAAGRAAAELARLIPQSAGLATGYIVIDADQPVAAMGWLATGTNPIAAALPAQQIDTPPSPPSADVPALAIGSSSLDFGNVPLGQSADRDLVLRNTGGATLQVSALEVPAPFRVILPSAPFIVAAGSSATLTVRFAPFAAGAQPGILTVVSNDPRTPRASIGLNGTGLGSIQPPIGASLSVLPTSLDFGEVPAGSSKTFTVTVSNGGGSAVQILSAASSHQAFSVTAPALPVSVPPSSPVVFTIRFAPAASGPQSGVIALSTGSTSLTIAVSGTGIAGGGPARITVAPAPLVFGNVEVGTTRDSNLTLTNTGPAPLDVTAVASSNPMFKLVSPPVPFTLSPGVNTTLSIRFAPTAVGEQKATLSLASSGGTAEAALSGTAVPLVVTTLFSDTFNDRDSSNACALGPADNALGGGSVIYYHPLYRYPVADRIAAVGGEILGGVLRNPNPGFSAVQFSGAEPSCVGGFASTFRQDFSLKMDVTVPPPPDPDQLTYAGPFFRGRMFDFGAPLIGEQSAGFWLKLYSNGAITLNRLAGNDVLASAPKLPAFDGRARHSLEMTLRDSFLQVSLDGVPVRFDRGITLTLPAETGNQGGAGIGFGVEGGISGGQSVDNLVVTTPRALAGN